MCTYYLRQIQLQCCRTIKECKFAIAHGQSSEHIRLKAPVAPVSRKKLYLYFLLLKNVELWKISDIKFWTTFLRPKKRSMRLQPHKLTTRSNYHTTTLQCRGARGGTGEDHLWESKIYIHFQPQKRVSNKSNNLICCPDSARKRKMRKMLFWDVWSFQFQSRWQGVWNFWSFWSFQSTMQFTKWTAVLKFLRFSI